MPDSTLRLTRFDSIDAFEDVALPFLLEREAEHNLFIRLLGQMREGRYPEWYLTAVTQSDRVVAATWRTPPHQLGLSLVDDRRALELIADDALDRFDHDITGVIATKEDARRFATIWSARTGCSSHLSMAQRIYRATHVDVPQGVRGEGRPATATERDVLIGWRNDFAVEALGEPDGYPERAVDRWLDTSHSDGCLVWWDDVPVSMVGYSASTPNGMGVAPVYTPPELRGRGYASACTAEVTKRILDRGFRFVFLFTDLSNPTSNSIYQKIGYRPVYDVDQYRFD